MSSPWWRRLERSLPPLAGLRHSSLGRQLSAAVEDLWSWLPGRLKHWLTSGRVWWVLVPDGEAWLLLQAGSGHSMDHWPADLEPAQQRLRLNQAMAAVEVPDRRLMLGVPAGSGLIRSLNLPLAARKALPQIARHEMDRQTPFSAEQVYFDMRERSAAGPAALKVELAVVPKAGLDRWLGHLREAGIGIDAVDLLDGLHARGFNLLPREARPHHPQPRQRLNMALAAAALVLVVLGLWQWGHNRQTLLHDMQQQVDAQDAEVRQISALRQQLLQVQAASEFLARRKQATIPVLAVLTEVSHRLPDDTSLDRLTIDNQGQLGLMGLAPQAARLVDMLKGSPYLTEPGFQGAILRDPLSGKERFFMTAQLRRAKSAGVGR